MFSFSLHSLQTALLTRPAWKVCKSPSRWRFVWPWLSHRWGTLSWSCWTCVLCRLSVSIARPPATTMAGCARVAMLQPVWGCANKPSSSWLIYLVYSERSPKRPSRGGGGGAGGGGGGGAGWMIQWPTAGRITPGILHIYTVKGVAELVVALQRPSGTAVRHDVCLCCPLDAMRCT